MRWRTGGTLTWFIQLPSKALESLSKRKWTEYKLPLTDKTERNEMIDTFFNIYRKKLTAQMNKQIIKAKSSANPLFLRAVLEEIRQFGNFEKLPAELNHYLKAKNPQELFRLVIRRWQHDFDADCDLVRRSLCYLWAARQGLAETEWLQLLGSKEKDLSRQILTPFFLSVEPHLTQHYGLYTFGHSFLRDAVKSEFMATISSEKMAHSALADFFEKQEESLRKTIELPWQLSRAGDLVRLKKQLIEMPMFLALYEYSMAELNSYWVMQAKERDFGGAYVESFETWAGKAADVFQIEDVGNKLFEYLFYSGLYEHAEPIIRYVLKSVERSSGKKDYYYAIILGNLARVLKHTNRRLEAEELMHQAMEITKEVLGENNDYYARAALNLAVLLIENKKYKTAQPLAEKAFEILGKSDQKDYLNIVDTLNVLAQIYEHTDRIAEAESFMRRALKTAEDHPEGVKDRIPLMLNNLAAFLQIMQKPEEAKPLLIRALYIFEDIYGKNHPLVATALQNLGIVFRDMNELIAAESLFKRSMSIHESHPGEDYIRVTGDLKLLILMYIDAQKYDKAEPLLRRAIRISEDVFGEDDAAVAEFLYYLSVLRMKVKDFKGAQQYIERALVTLFKISREIGRVHENLNGFVEFYASLLSELGFDHNQTFDKIKALAPDFVLKMDIQGKDPADESEVEKRQSAESNILGEREPDFNEANQEEESGMEQRFPTVMERLKYFSKLLMHIKSVQQAKELLEMEPVLQTALGMLVMVSREIGYEKFNIHTDSYPELLEKIGLTEQQIVAKLQHLGGELYAPKPVNTGVNNILRKKAKELREQGNLEKAERLLRAALESDQRLYGTDHENTALGLRELAEVLIDGQQFQEAKTLLNQELTIIEKIDDKDLEMAECLFELSVCLRGENKHDEAEPFLKRAILILLKVSKGDNQLHKDFEHYVREYKSILASMGLNEDQQLAYLNLIEPERVAGLANKKRLADQRNLRKDKNAEGEKLTSPPKETNGGEDTDDLEEIVIDMDNLNKWMKDPEALTKKEAEPLIKYLLRLDSERIAKKQPEIAHYLVAISSFADAHKWEIEAELLARKALEILFINFEKTGEKHSDLDAISQYYVKLLGHIGYKYDQIVAKIKEIAPSRFVITDNSTENQEASIALRKKAAKLNAQGDVKEAISVMRQVIEIDQKKHGHNSRWASSDLNQLARYLIDDKRLIEAEVSLRRALEIDEEYYGRDHKQVGLDLSSIARLLLEYRRFEEAEPFARRALEITEKNLGENHPEVATSLNNLATPLMLTKKYDEAEPLMQRAIIILKENIRTDESLKSAFKTLTSNYSDMLENMGLGKKEIAKKLQKLAPEFFK